MFITIIRETVTTLEENVKLKEKLSVETSPQSEIKVSKIIVNTVYVQTSKR